MWLAGVIFVLQSNATPICRKGLLHSQGQTDNRPKVKYLPAQMLVGFLFSNASRCILKYVFLWGGASIPSIPCIMAVPVSLPCWRRCSSPRPPGSRSCARWTDVPTALPSGCWAGLGSTVHLKDTLVNKRKHCVPEGHTVPQEALY